MSYPLSNDEEEEVLEKIFANMKIDAIRSVQVNINNETATDIDILGAYKNALLIIECSGRERNFSEKLRRFVADSQLLSKHLREVGQILRNGNERFREFYQKTKGLWEKVERGQNIVVKYILFTTRRLSEGYRKEAREYSKEIYLIDFDDFSYFDYLSKLTFDHARYEFLIFLEIKPEEIDDRISILSPVVKGKIVENSVEQDIIVFTHFPSFLLRTTHVRRLYSWNPQGFQRLLLEDKLKKLANFLKKEKKSFPNNIIVATIRNGKLEYRPDYINKTFEMNFKDFSYDIFVLIDGQHRLYAFAYNDPDIEQLRENICLLVTAIIFKDVDETRMSNRMAELFYTINTTYTRIDPKTSIDLNERLRPDSPVSRANKLLRMLNNDDSTFLKNKIEFSPFDEKYFGKKLLPRTALIKYSGLKEFFAPKSKTYKILQKTYSLLRSSLPDYDNDFLPWILKVYLKAVKASLEEAMGERSKLLLEDTELRQYYFMTVTVIGALFRLLRHFLSSNNPNTKVKKLLEILEDNNLTLDKKENEMKQIIKEFLRSVFSKVNFTKEEWINKGWKSSQWALVEREMVDIINKEHEIFGDKRLLKNSALSAQ